MLKQLQTQTERKQKSLAVGIVIASNAHCGAFYISVQML